MSHHPKPGIREHIHAGITAGLAGAYDEGSQALRTGRYGDPPSAMGRGAEATLC